MRPGDFQRASLNAPPLLGLETGKLWLATPHAASPVGPLACLVASLARIGALGALGKFHNVATTETGHLLGLIIIPRLDPASSGQPATPLRCLRNYNGHLTFSLPHLILPRFQQFHTTGLRRCGSRGTQG